MTARLKRDCYNCVHSVGRHSDRKLRKNTLVCLVHAVGVNPNQLRDFHVFPCGSRVVDGECQLRQVRTTVRRRGRHRG